MIRTFLAAILLLILIQPCQSWAARLFDGTNDNLQSASALAFPNTVGLKYALSFWLWVNTFDATARIAFEYSADNSGASTTDNRFRLLGTSTASNMSFSLYGLGASALFQNTTWTYPSAAAWHHYVINVDLSLASNSTVSVYVDGSTVSLSRSGTATFSGDSMAQQVLNVMSRNNTSNYQAGRLADFAIYTGLNLSGSDVTSLNGGTAPTSVQSGNLLYYWPLCGDASPEPATTGAINMTVNNGATQTAHPSAIAAACPGATAMQSSSGFLGSILK